jgi:hypothetical protein
MQVAANDHHGPDAADKDTEALMPSAKAFALRACFFSLTNDIGA